MKLEVSFSFSGSRYKQVLMEKDKTCLTKRKEIDADIFATKHNTYEVLSLFFLSVLILSGGGLGECTDGF